MTLKTDLPNSATPTAESDAEPARRTLVVASIFRASRTTWVVCMVVVLSLLPRLLTAGHFTTYDEPLWRRRSSNFVDALGSGAFGDASAVSSDGGGTATMPGITTMWIGSLARGVWSIGRSLELWSNDEIQFADSPAGLAVAQVAMAVVLSALIGFVAFLVAKWAGNVAAGAIAGVLLATEPYLVALGAVLHTDELMSLLGVAAMLTTALVFGLPRPTSWQGRWWAAALAGGLFGAALLTKLSALPFLAGLSGMGVWALLRAHAGHRRHVAAADESAHVDAHRPPLDVRAIVRLGALWIAAAVALFVVSYPALWAEPLGELRHLRDSAGLAGAGHSQFFLGERTTTPGPGYLFVTLPMRSTPWFLIGGVAAGITMLWRRHLRSFGLLAAGMALPIFLVVSFASKQGVRYALSVQIVGAIVVGIVGSKVVSRRSSRTSLRLPIAWATAAVVVLVTVHSVTVAPYGNAYFNPVLGGGSTAERAHLIGSGEGLDEAGDLIREREGQRCDDVLIWTYPIHDAFPCGKLTSREDASSRADYVVLYINQRQRKPAGFLEQLTAGRELLDTVTIRGILYAEVFGPAT